MSVRYATWRVKAGPSKRPQRLCFLLAFFVTSYRSLPVMQTQAEKAAWALSKKYGFELVTVNPVFVFGPVLSPRADATSVLMMKVNQQTL